MAEGPGSGAHAVPDAQVEAVGQAVPTVTDLFRDHHLELVRLALPDNHSKTG